MERIYRTRRERLRSAALEQFEERGMRKRLADLLGCDANYVSRMLSVRGASGHKRIGEEMARHIEEVLEKPSYWLDGYEDPQRDWPFQRVTPDRLKGLSSREIDRLETVLETTLALMDDERKSPFSPTDRRSRA